MKTLQQVYDAGLAHIRAQGKPSISHRVCKYRMTDSTGAKLKCIIGGLIPDELYDPDWDSDASTVASHLPDHVLDAIYNKPDPITPLELALLQSMQFAHDKAAYRHPASFMQDFEAVMSGLAEKYGLIYTAP